MSILQSTPAVVLEGVIQDADHADSSYATTPDLVLPDDLELSEHVDDAHAHVRRSSGGDESIDECESLLVIPPGAESEVGDRTCSGDVSAHVGQSEAVSSKTASSASLAPPQAHSRSPLSGSKHRLPPVNQSDVLPPLLPVSQPAKDGSRVEYRIITWDSYVAEERKRPSVYKLAKDLPHSLQDYMNMFPDQIRNSDIGREVFEAHIREAMVNEHAAPAIEIFDNNIADEVTPRWEFHYTNEMWYSEGVPPPDLEGLQGCGCIGRCDPKSSTCACAQRQRKWVKPYIDDGIIPPRWAGSPFVYDHKGLLQRFECPIFECNRFCRCNDDCPNRVRTCCVFVLLLADDDDR